MTRIQMQKMVDEALREAVRRWGKNASVRYDPPLMPKDVERKKAAILADEQKRETKTAPEGERCTYVDRRGYRCHYAKKGHGTAHAPRPTLEERIAIWEQSLIAEKLNGWATVGVIALGLFFEVRGQGVTFAEAFLDYDWNEARDEDRDRARAAFEEAIANVPRTKCRCKHAASMHRQKGVTVDGRYLGIGSCSVHGCGCALFAASTLKPPDLELQHKRLAALQKAREAKAAKRRGAAGCAEGAHRYERQNGGRAVCECGAEEAQQPEVAS